MRHRAPPPGVVHKSTNKGKAHDEDQKLCNAKINSECKDQAISEGNIRLATMQGDNVARFTGKTNIRARLAMAGRTGPRQAILEDAPGVSGEDGARTLARRLTSRIHMRPEF